MSLTEKKHISLQKISVPNLIAFALFHGWISKCNLYKSGAHQMEPPSPLIS